LTIIVDIVVLILVTFLASFFFNFMPSSHSSAAVRRLVLIAVAVQSELLTHSVVEQQKALVFHL